MPRYLSGGPCLSCQHTITQTCLTDPSQIGALFSTQGLGNMVISDAKPPGDSLFACDIHALEWSMSLGACVQACLTTLKPSSHPCYPRLVHRSRLSPLRCVGCMGIFFDSILKECPPPHTHTCSSSVWEKSQPWPKSRPDPTHYMAVSRKDKLLALGTQTASQIDCMKRQLSPGLQPRLGQECRTGIL